VNRARLHHHHHHHLADVLEDVLGFIFQNEIIFVYLAIIVLQLLQMETDVIVHSLH
jgi:hypothetical protein